MDSIETRIALFRERMKTEYDFCQELYRYATVRLLACKYAYYVLSEEIVKDISYDLSEKDWYVMGRALGHLQEDDTSPCIDWNPDHPLASEAIELASKLL